MPLIDDTHKPSILLLYHFFFPDDVASASHMYQLAQELTQRGWRVTVLTTNRYCREPQRRIPDKEEHVQGIHVIRLPRPAWNQASPLQRMLNSAWVIASWLVKLVRMQSFDVILVGSDPAFAPLIIPGALFCKKATILAHWCFDLYPEVAMADSGVQMHTTIIALLQRLMGRSYRAAHLIADLGSCMRRRLASYNHGAQEATLVPWALVEPEALTPPNLELRKSMFGDATFGLLYSGTLGRAHDYEMFLKLARLLRHRSPHIRLCFAARGNKVAELKRALTYEDTNIALVDFVAESMLEEHLNAADMHMISLNKEWSGLVVPSKFFGSLATGKPVIYAGPADSSIAGLLREHEIGFYIDEKSLENVAAILDYLSTNRSALNLLQKNAFEVYKSSFSKKIIVDKWDRVLRQLISDAHSSK
jgi:glycosyltransferase involved in cell wall biosynthesis